MEYWNESNAESEESRRTLEIQRELAEGLNNGEKSDTKAPLLKSTILYILQMLQKREKKKQEPAYYVKLGFVVIAIFFLFSLISTFAVFFTTEPFKSNSSIGTRLLRLHRRRPGV